MRLISIEHKSGLEKTVINTDQICSIFKDDGIVVIATGDDRLLKTKFTDIDHAVDYIQRAASHSMAQYMVP